MRQRDHVHTGADPLVPLDVVTVGEHSIVPDVSRPVAAVVRRRGGRGAVRWLTWPDALLPERAIEEATAWPTSTGVWVVYRSDGIDDETRTAVFVGPGGVGTSVDLGHRSPIGADATGLWVGDPRDASDWTHAFGGDGTAGVPDVDDVSLDWADKGPFWPDPATWTQPGPGEDEDGSGGPFTISGVADEEWTIGIDDVPDPEASQCDGDPRSLPPVRTGPTDVERIGPDGTRHAVHVDHFVDRVVLDGDDLTLRFHRTGPRSDPDAGPFSSSVYEPETVTVDVSSGLPDTVRTEELQALPATPEDDDEWEREVVARERRRARWTDRLDLAGVPGADWSRTDPGGTVVERQVARLRAQFTGLDRPVLSWSRDTDGPMRRRSDYRDVEVTVEGDWPETVVVVAFEHTSVPFLRLRRRYRVHDDTGRPRDWGYATVHLDEDIGSGHIPPRSAAVDGVLDI